MNQASLLIACSGGLDSVVLAHLCHHLGFDMTLGHCNFKLRDGESDGDQTFVETLSKDLGLGYRTRTFDTQEYAENHRGSIQMAARKLRYQWFLELAQTEEFDYVLTAHHADDALETFIINLSRGTGIDGLTGIPVQNGHIIRPLLPFARREIQEFAEANKLEWREDSSNADTKYLRNKIRKEIIPELKTLHPTFLENFGTTQANLQQQKALGDIYIQKVKSAVFEEKEGRTYIKLSSLQSLQPLEAHLYELFKPYGFTDWKNIQALLAAESGKEIHSKTHRLLKDREHLLLSEHLERDDGNYVIPEGTSTLGDPIALCMETVDQLQDGHKLAIYVDNEKLNYPLILRNWKKGDYFYPFGMQGKKKLSKFFKDEKMDVFSKEDQWLLCSGDDVVWVVGKRADDRFKVDANTRQILKISLLV
nr:tRNA lysidine(34) synthetase TilS [Allomuricauda sp.]